jgi:hypothetical protein
MDLISNARLCEEERRSPSERIHPGGQSHSYLQFHNTVNILSIQTGI